jgi:hypothetical protein
LNRQGVLDSDDARIASRTAAATMCRGLISIFSKTPLRRSLLNCFDGIERELAAVMRRPSNPALNVNQERLHFCGYVPRSEVSRLRSVSTGFIARPESI